MKHTTLAEIIQRSSELLNEKAAAEILSVEPGTLAVWRSTGRYNIPFIKVGRNVRYSRKALEAWLESRTHATGATA
jgi:predicted site-specific integrase-resolvase